MQEFIRPRGLGDSSVRRVLASQAWRLEWMLSSHIKIPGVLADVCNSSVGEGGRRQVDPTQPFLVNEVQVLWKNLFQKKKKKHWKTTKKGLNSHTCAVTHNHAHTDMYVHTLHAHTHTYTYSVAHTMKDWMTPLCWFKGVNVKRTNSFSVQETESLQAIGSKNAA